MGLLQLRRMPAYATAAVRFVSRQSYALYLVHLSLLQAVSLQFAAGMPGAWCVVTAVTTIFAVAYGLQRWIEAPIMARRPKQYVSVADSAPMRAAPVPELT